MSARRKFSAALLAAAALLLGGISAGFFPHGAVSAPSGGAAKPTPQWTGIYDLQGKVALQWIFDHRFQAVRIYRRLAATFTEPFEVVAEVKTTHYVDSSVDAGQTYLYRLAGVFADGTESEYSVDRTVKVAGQAVRVASPPEWEGHLLTREGIGLKWKGRPDEDVLAYNIYRRIKPEDNPVLIGSTPDTLYHDRDVEDGGSYIYFLSALDRNFRESGFSEEFRATYKRPRAAAKADAEPEWRYLRTRLVAEIRGGRRPFFRPADVVFNTRSRQVYVSDSGNDVIEVFDAEGSYLRTIGPLGNRPAPFHRPLGMTTDPQGFFYVVDSGGRAVLSLNDVGRVSQRIDFDTFFHKAPLGLIDLAVRGDGRMYVVDNYNKRIVIVDEGKVASIFGKPGFQPGAFSAPTFCAFDEAGLFYVADAMNGRVQVFDGEGEFVRSFGRYKQGPGGLGRPKGIAVGAGGEVYVADSWQNVIQVFDREGRFRALLTDEGGNPLDLGSPNGIALGDRGRIYIAERLSRRLQVREILDDI